MFKPSGPAGVARPFAPANTLDVAERIAHALESIAVSLAALDHHVEVIASRTPKVR